MKGGIIIAKTRIEGLIAAERIPSAYLVSIYDTEPKQMLWNRTDSDIEPSAYEHSSPVASPASTPRATTWLHEMRRIWAMNLMPARLTPMPPLHLMRVAQQQPGNATKQK